jgi:oligosaccharide reducing-end xylanase
VRTGRRLGISLVAAAAALALAPGTALAGGLPAGLEHSPVGAYRTGVYPNLFAHDGHSRPAIRARLDAAWNQLFHGDPGTAPRHDDGQTLYYQLTPDMAYVEDIGNQDVRTEGMGYAMMIAVQTNHKREFDSLWNFAKTKMQLQSGPTKDYFAWHTDTTGKIIDPGVAPDGDQWIAAALTFASGRWGDGSATYDYGQQAKQILHAMWHESDTGGVNMFDATHYLPLFTPPATSLYFTDPSYALPTFYRIFAVEDLADKALWDKATGAAETMLQTAPNPQTGLAPDYAGFDAKPFPAPWDPTNPDGYGQNFQEDAWRVIANANVDAMWFGVRPWQSAYSNTLERFFDAQGVSTYVSRYHPDGTPITNGQNTYEPAHAQGLVAMNSTSAMSATIRGKRAFVEDLWNTAIPSGRARYYDGMLYFLGLLYDSGNFRIWLPHHRL